MLDFGWGWTCNGRRPGHEMNSRGSLLAKRNSNAQSPETTSATVGYEAELWKMADALRGSMDAAEYKHVVLGLIFLKYISDAFEEQHAKLEASGRRAPTPRTPTSTGRANIFWVPPEARWSHLKAQAKQPTIGQLVDDAMAGIERDNPSLKGVLPKDYARPALDKQRLGQLIDLSATSVGDAESRSKDILGRVYEYFLSQFASAEGKKGGEFYTPRCVVKLLVEMLEPYKGRVYDPCCGSSGMFVQSIEFIRAHGAERQRRQGQGDISIYGQESNHTTWRLAKMNLAIRGIEGQIAHGDTFHNDLHPGPQGRLHPRQSALQRQRLARRAAARGQALEVRRAAGRQRQLRLGAAHDPPPRARRAWRASCWPTARCPPTSPARARSARTSSKPTWWTAWSPCRASSSTRRRSRPACGSWRATRRSGKFRDRRGQVLFIDARKLGRMVDRTHRELTDEDIARIAGTYHAWRGEKDAGEYADVPGFCKSATLEEIRKHGHVLTPGRYVGAEAQEDDGEPFEEKMKRLTATLREQMAEAAKLDAAIAANLKELGYGG